MAGKMAAESREFIGEVTDIEIVNEAKPTLEIEGNPTIGVHRIDLPDKQWWDVDAEVGYGLREVIDMAQFEGISLSGGQEGIDLDNPEAVQKLLLSDMSIMLRSNANTNNSMLVNGTVAWSFGIEVSIQAIRKLPERYVKPVLDWMREHYASLTADQSGN